MDEPHDVKIAEAARDTASARIARHGVGLLRGITFTALLIIYVVWTLAVAVQIVVESGGPVVNFKGALIGLAFLVSLPGLGYLCTARDKGGNFMTPSVMVVLLFLSYGLLAGYILFLGLAFVSGATSVVWMVSTWVGILSPILAVALAMLLAGIVRTKMVWEPESKRLKATKYWLYLSPPLFFLTCQVLYIVGSLVG